MFGTLGGPELFLIFVVALIVFGPRKLPDIGKSLGRMMSEFRRASNEFKSTIESEVESEKIRESMRVEPPKVTKSRTPPPGAATQATEGPTRAAAGDRKGAGESSGGEVSGAATGTSTGEVGPEGEQKDPAAPPPPSSSTPDSEPATVSRQPPPPESK
jgi:Tat protein translocase TatB subunit